MAQSKTLAIKFKWNLVFLDLEERFKPLYTHHIVYTSLHPAGTYASELP